MPWRTIAFDGDQPGCEVQAMAAVSVGHGGPLAFAQLEHRELRLVNLEARFDALEQAAAIVGHQQVLMPLEREKGRKGRPVQGDVLGDGPGRRPFGKLRRA